MYLILTRIIKIRGDFMALIDTYRNNVKNKKNQLMRLTEEKSKENKKYSDIMQKIQSARDTINRTSSQSTLKSKFAEIDRLQKQLSKVSKKISDIDTKVFRKEKELNAELNKLNKEELKVEKKRTDEVMKMEKERTKHLKELDNSIKENTRNYKAVSDRVFELEKLPKQINVLFLAMSPKDQALLSLDEEARLITEMIRKSKHRDSVNFITCWAVRPVDILQSINEHEPSIIHFSGHGSNDAIAFQDDYGNTKLVSKEAIVQTMMASCSNIKLVFFNTCYSSNQAESVVRYIDATIGMNNSIGDKAARYFAAQFYSAIGFGLSMQKSFDQAKALLMLEGINEEKTPELFVAEGVDAEKVFLVSPDTLTEK